MKITQNYIDNLTNNEFIEKFIECDNDWIDIEETREIVQFNNSRTFNVRFHYDISINRRSLFGNQRGSFERTIIDDVYFNDEKDAEFYLNNVRMPSRQFFDSTRSSWDSKYGWRNHIYLKDVALEKTMKSHGFVEAAYDRKQNKLFYGLYGTCIYDSISFKTAFNSLIAKYMANRRQDYKVIKTISINQLINNRNEAIMQIKENLKEHKNDLAEVIVAEIDRTQNYLDFLIKLSKS